MVDVKQAIAKAKAYAAEVLGESELLLEEVHSSEDRFKITLSFPERRSPKLTNINPMLSQRAWSQEREYKSFDVDKRSGDVLEMSIRQLGVE